MGFHCQYRHSSREGTAVWAHFYFISLSVFIDSFIPDIFALEHPVLFTSLNFEMRFAQIVLVALLVLSLSCGACKFSIQSQFPDQRCLLLSPCSLLTISDPTQPTRRKTLSPRNASSSALNGYRQDITSSAPVPASAMATWCPSSPARATSAAKAVSDVDDTGLAHSP